MKKRSGELQILRRLLRKTPVVGIIGARQVGKTTLARNLISGHDGPVEVFDLENPEDAARLADPMLALKPLKGLVVLDEIQRQPDIFPILRVLADRPRRSCRFLVLGSASPELLRQSSESLAGRIAYHHLGGFSLGEVDTNEYTKLWRRGGFPKAFLAESDRASMSWRRDFIGTFLERDLPQLGITTSAVTMRRFWTMVAHYHGQTWNASEFARSFGVADTTVRNYLDHLTAALVVRQLKPWHENVGKRQVKSPKVYVNDAGLLHALLNLATQADLESHPKLGASWEGFVIDQVARLLRAEPEECHFWATHAGAELDLFVIRGKKRLGFEMKRTSAPKVTASMKIALQDLRLDRLDVIYAGEKTFQLAPRIRAVPLQNILTEIKPF